MEAGHLKPVFARREGGPGAGRPAKRYEVAPETETVLLTASGRTLAEHARRALDELGRARLATAGQVQELRGSLAIGCFDSAGHYLIPAVLASLYCDSALAARTVEPTRAHPDSILRR